MSGGARIKGRLIGKTQARAISHRPPQWHRAIVRLTSSTVYCSVQCTVLYCRSYSSDTGASGFLKPHVFVSCDATLRTNERSGWNGSSRHAKEAGTRAIRSLRRPDFRGASDLREPLPLPPRLPSSRPARPLRVLHRTARHGTARGGTSPTGDRSALCEKASSTALHCAESQLRVISDANGPDSNKRFALV